MTAQAIADAYMIHKVEVAEGGDEITERFITTAMRVQEYLLSVKAVKAVIFEMEELYGQQSPFNKILRLEAFYSRTKDPNVLTWIFQSIHDGFLSGAMTTESNFSVQSLSGGTGGRGDIDVWMMKLKLHDYLLGTWLEKGDAPTEVKCSIRKVLQSFSSYRANLKRHNGDSPDLGWSAGWGDGSRRLLHFCEDTARNFGTSGRLSRIRHLCVFDITSSRWCGGVGNRRTLHRWGLRAGRHLRESARRVNQARDKGPQVARGVSGVRDGRRDHHRGHPACAEGKSGCGARCYRRDWEC